MGEASEVTNPQKAKGSQWERDVVKFLKPWFPYIERAYGAGRQDDRGDLTGTPGIVWELKNWEKFDLAGWMDEAWTERVNAKARLSIVVAKRRGHAPAHAYAILPLEDMAMILKEAGY